MAVEPEPSPPNGHKDSKPHHRWPNFPGLFVSTSLGVRPSAEEMKTSAEEREQKLQGEIADAVLTCLFGSVSDAPCSGDSLALTQIEGGISNLLYRVAFPEPQLVQGEEWVSVLVGDVVKRYYLSHSNSGHPRKQCGGHSSCHTTRSMHTIFSLNAVF